MNKFALLVFVTISLSSFGYSDYLHIKAFSQADQNLMGSWILENKSASSKESERTTKSGTEFVKFSYKVSRMSGNSIKILLQQFVDIRINGKSTKYLWDESTIDEKNNTLKVVHHIKVADNNVIQFVSDFAKFDFFVTDMHGKPSVKTQ
jgi:hypothetical protein